MKLDMSTLKDKVITAYNKANDKVNAFCGRHPFAVRMAVVLTPTLVGLLYGSAHALAENANSITGRIAGELRSAGADGIMGTGDDYWQISIRASDGLNHNVLFYARDSSVGTIDGYAGAFSENDTVYVDYYQNADGIYCGEYIHGIRSESCAITPMLLGITGLGAAISAKFARRKKNA